MLHFIIFFLKKINVRTSEPHCSRTHALTCARTARPKPTLYCADARGSRLALSARPVRWVVALVALVLSHLSPTLWRAQLAEHRKKLAKVWKQTPNQSLYLLFLLLFHFLFMLFYILTLFVRFTLAPSFLIWCVVHDYSTELLVSSRCLAKRQMRWIGHSAR